MITNLPRAVPAPPGKPVRPEAPRGQERARRLALRPGTWTQVAVDLSFGMLSRPAQPGRIQADGGPLIVSNALGDGAPFRVPAEELIEAMVSATSRPWDALQSEAHWGIWTILRAARR